MTELYSPAVERRVRLIAGLLGVAAITRLFSLWWLHPLNWDEIEYFRAADWIRQGLVPYRDFWEHHTPLQWFLFAPVTAALRSSRGADAILSMRLAQVPLWAFTFWLLLRWMRNAGLPAWTRWAALTISLCGSFFMLPAVEFRVDTLGCALFVFGLLLIQEGHRFAAGAMFCLAGFANIRLGPVLVATLLLVAVIDPRQRRWTIVNRTASMLAGAMVAFAGCASYFVLTRSWAPAFRYVWTDNYIAEKLALPVPGMFLHRIAAPFGFRLIGRGPRFVAESIDLATIGILLIGTVAILWTIYRKWRMPDDFLLLALIQVVNLAFLARMKFLYNYHFEMAVLLMLPFVALLFSRLRLERGIVAGVVLLVAINAAVVLFRGKEEDLAYQDRIMREVDRATPPGAKVFDGVGWALRRQPAYRYWFLRAIVNVLEASGRFEPYTVADLRRDPPAAFISDFGARVWLAKHADLRRAVTAHYLPAWRDLWLPGMSGVLAPGAAQEWIVPADGQYRVYGSPQLAQHPWFNAPIATGSYARPDSYVRMADIRNDARLFCSSGLTLRRGQSFRIESRDARTIGVFIVPADRSELFRQPPPGVDLDAALPPVTHVPHFGR
jgi:hypothetical protein